MDEKVIGYCVKCKEKREMKDVQKVEIKPGRPAAKGTCTVCGTGTKFCRKTNNQT